MKPAVPQTLPIKNLNWERLLPLIGKANRALAGYDSALHRLPNSSLLLSPLTRQEAVLSSRIEGTFATMSEVLQFEAGEIPQQESKRLDIEEIINYQRALKVATEELRTRPFNLNLLLELHRVLLTSVRGYDKAPGTFRRQQNYIGSRTAGVETIRFTPPTWTALKDGLDNWEKYYHSDDLDPIVQLALIHAQFEFLHPFLDGNGRLGRILIPVFLFEKRLLSQPTFYLSEYIEKNKDEYCDRLNALGRSRQSWTLWVEFFLQAVIWQAERNHAKSDRILSLYEDLKQRFIETTRSPFAIPLLDAAFQLPIFQASQLTWSMTPPSKPTLMNLLQSLAQQGTLVIVREGLGRRPYIWALPKLIQIAEGRE